MSNPIDSKGKRDKLKPRREPYWARLEKGGALGFRKLAVGDGTWSARWTDDEYKKHYKSLGKFDTFDAAAKEARRWLASCTSGASPKTVTVADACRSYVNALRMEQRLKTAHDAEGRFRRLVYGTAIGKTDLDRLKTIQVEKWLHDQVADDDEDDEEDIRRSKDSANRNLATLKAALNRALKHRIVETDSGWKTVAAFPKVGARRKDAFLTLEDRRNLLASCPDDLRQLCEAILYTGTRPGELAKMNVGDFRRDQGIISLTGKTGTRTVPISDTGMALFVRLSGNRLIDEPMLMTAYGQRWNKDAWKDIFKRACADAALPSTVVMYSLRHTSISESILSGMDAFIVAKITGTSVEMIERNYGHIRNEAVRPMLNAISML